MRLVRSQIRQAILHPNPGVRSAADRIGRNDRCPCGSGKKYKNCCYRTGAEAEDAGEDISEPTSQTRSRSSSSQYPIGTVAMYGPDKQTTTKVVAGVIKWDGAEPILERWVGTNILNSPKMRQQMEKFFARYKVKSVATSDGNMGCPHEEGEDFPEGEDCPFCPYWSGKQGSNRHE